MNNEIVNPSDNIVRNTSLDLAAVLSRITQGITVADLTSEQIDPKQSLMLKLGLIPFSVIPDLIADFLQNRTLTDIKREPKVYSAIFFLLNALCGKKPLHPLLFELKRNATHTLFDLACNIYSQVRAYYRSVVDDVYDATDDGILMEIEQVVKNMQEIWQKAGYKEVICIDDGDDTEVRGPKTKKSRTGKVAAAVDSRKSSSKSSSTFFVATAGVATIASIETPLPRVFKGKKDRNKEKNGV